jgi:hypothetical protein
MERNGNVKGFSYRLVKLLDAYDFPHTARYTAGAEVFGVSINTFRNWCVNDVTPRNLSTLKSLVYNVTNKKLSECDINCVCAWICFDVQTIKARQILHPGVAILND